jgi:hypothetical protein
VETRLETRNPPSIHRILGSMLQPLRAKGTPREGAGPLPALPPRDLRLLPPTSYLPPGRNTSQLALWGGRRKS